MFLGGFVEFGCGLLPFYQGYLWCLVGLRESLGVEVGVEILAWLCKSYQNTGLCVAMMELCLWSKDEYLDYYEMFCSKEVPEICSLILEWNRLRLGAVNGGEATENSERFPVVTMEPGKYILEDTLYQ